MQLHHAAPVLDCLQSLLLILAAGVEQLSGQHYDSLLGHFDLLGDAFRGCQKLLLLLICFALLEEIGEVLHVD